jgi:hypothetical protein
MTYDAALGRVVAYGGADNNARRQFTDTWAWDGSNWGLLGTASDPGPRVLSTMVPRRRPAPERPRRRQLGDHAARHLAARRRERRPGRGDGAARRRLRGRWPTAALGRGRALRRQPRVRGRHAVGARQQPLRHRARRRVAAAVVGRRCTLYLASPIAAFGTSTDAIGFATLGLSIPRAPEPVRRGSPSRRRSSSILPQNGIGLTVSAALKITLGF